MNEQLECPRRDNQCDVCLEVGRYAASVVLENLKPDMDEESRRVLVEGSGLRARLEDDGVEALSCDVRIQRAREIGLQIGEKL